MRLFQKIALPAFLLLGLSVGAGVAYVLSGQTPEVSAPLNANRFAVDPNNTPGFPEVKGGDFALIDQDGNPRTSRDPQGRHQLLFFGYAKCKAICSVALPNIAEATTLLEGMNVLVTPVLITVDPKRDTIDALKLAVKDIHAKMQGLTGSEEALSAAYKAFNLEKKFLFDHADEGAVYSHGSFIYLLGPDGKFKTLFAPVISPVRIAEITAGYVAQDQNKAATGS